MAQGLIARFFIEGVHMTAKSEKAGRPIFEDQEFVEIIPIGDNKTKVVKPVTDELRQRFAEEYSVFKKGVEMTFEGTPLTQWPIMTPSVIKQFQHFNVYTVDQMAELNDIAINKIGPGTRDWVEKAKAFMAKAASTAEAQKFALDNERLREDLARQQATINELSQKIEELSGAGGQQKNKAA